MTSRIEQCIEEIAEYIDNCKYQPLSNTKIVVNKEEFEELIEELRRKTPEEIKRYQRMLSNKEAILADAQSKADTIIADAQVHTSELISEHQIMQQAYAQANEIVMAATNQAQEVLDNAANDANNIRIAAIQYTDDILKNLESIISHAMDTTRARSENLLSSLQGCYDLVNANRAELSPEELEAQEANEAASRQPEADMMP
ncbi:MAG: ATPase [Lachnospiraceae bacterium]|nr:ATPase [Lachnospiraceae bacterium]MCI9150778.1 ATPase [Lachnospiraceae bacterium]